MPRDMRHALTHAMLRVSVWYQQTG